MTLEEYKAISPVFEEDIYEAISMETCVNKRLTIGAPGADAMNEVLKQYREYLAKQVFKCAHIMLETLNGFNCI